MILFYGYGDDRPLEAAIDAATTLGIDRMLIDQRQAAFSELLLESGPDGLAGSLVVADTSIALSDISAVYARPLTPVATADSRANERAIAFNEAFLDWMDIANCRIVNRPAAMHSNASKPFQAQIIAEAGFSVPDTLVTNEPELAHRFWRDHGDVIFKSTSGVRSIVRRLDDRRAEHLERLRALPTMFQEFVPGVDVRVHVVGTLIFASEIRSSAVDYRYAGRDGLDADLVPINLRGDVAERCVLVAERLQLPFCGIDLRRRPGGEYVCFEVNPMPGYSYFESETGQPISRALVEYLARVTS